MPTSCFVTDETHRSHPGSLAWPLNCFARGEEMGGSPAVPQVLVLCPVGSDALCSAVCHKLFFQLVLLLQPWFLASREVLSESQCP